MPNVSFYFLDYMQRHSYQIIETATNSTSSIVTTYKKYNSYYELHLMRSYDRSKRPDRPRTPTSLKIPIWVVARAASADPILFKPIWRRTANGYFAFKAADGKHDTNPTIDVIHDIHDQSGMKSIDIAISIGTSREQPSLSLRQLFLTKRVLGRREDTKAVTNHERVCGLSAVHGFRYYRLDTVHRGKHPPSATTDEWKPRSEGSKKRVNGKTIRDIEQSLQNWLDNPMNANYLDLCARELVDKRLKRANQRSPRWERYALETVFECRHAPCAHSEERNRYLSHYEFEGHLIEEHWFIAGSAILSREAEICRIPQYGGASRRETLTAEEPSSPRTPSERYKPPKEKEERLNEISLPSKEIQESPQPKKRESLQEQYSKVIEIIGNALESENSYKLCPPVAIALDSVVSRLEIWHDELLSEVEARRRTLEDIQANFGAISSTMIEALEIILQRVRSVLEWQKGYEAALEEAGSELPVPGDDLIEKLPEALADLIDLSQIIRSQREYNTVKQKIRRMTSINPMSEGLEPQASTIESMSDKH